METLFQLWDAIWREEPLRIDPQVDFPHLMWITRFNQKLRVRGSLSRAGGETERNRLSSQVFNDLTNAFGVKFCGAGDENLSIFTGNIGNHGTVGTQGCANLGH